LKKIAFLHGFLGSPEDMWPLYIDGVENVSIDVKSLLFSDRPIEDLREHVVTADVLVGYSFGGRLLGELKKQSHLEKTWVFVSSRHSPYSPEQLAEREVFRNKLAHLIQTDLQSFNEYWNSLPLFSGHIMSEYREKHALPFRPWTEEEKLKYLECFFNSKQFFPEADKSVHYFHGQQDEKYTQEAQRLESVFQTHVLKGVGHRAPFEDVKQFKQHLKKVCDL